MHHKNENQFKYSVDKDYYTPETNEKVILA